MVIKKLKECSIGELNEFTKKFGENNVVIIFEPKEHQFRVGVGKFLNRVWLGMNDEINLDQLEQRVQDNQKLSINSSSMQFLKNEFGVLNKEYELMLATYGNGTCFFKLRKDAVTHYDMKQSWSHKDTLMEIKPLKERMTPFVWYKIEDLFAIHN